MKEMKKVRLQGICQCLELLASDILYEIMKDPELSADSDCRGLAEKIASAALAGHTIATYKADDPETGKLLANVYDGLVKSFD